MYKRAEDGEWEEAIRTRALVKPGGVDADIVDDIMERKPPDDIYLRTKLTYEFQVIAINSIITGGSASGRCETLPSTAATTACSRATGACTAFIWPYLVGKANEDDDG